jgi:hypothetical protein
MKFDKPNFSAPQGLHLHTFWSIPEEYKRRQDTSKCLRKVLGQCRTFLEIVQSQRAGREGKTGPVKYYKWKYGLRCVVRFAVLHELNTDLSVADHLKHKTNYRKYKKHDRMTMIPCFKFAVCAGVCCDGGACNRS